MKSQNQIVPSANLTLKPDENVVKLINKLTVYFKQSEKAKRFDEARNVKQRMDLLKKTELKRQKTNLR